VANGPNVFQMLLVWKGESSETESLGTEVLQVLGIWAWRTSSSESGNLQIMYSEKKQKQNTWNIML